MLKHLLMGSAIAFSPADVGGGGGDKLPELSKAAAQSIYDKAVAAGEAMNEETLEDVAQFIEDKEAVTRGPIILCGDLERNYTLPVIADWPEPGSKAGETGNRQPDKFTLTVIVDGQSKKKPQSFYSIVFDSTSKGRSLLLRMRAIDMADKGEATTPEGFDAEEFKALKRMLPVDRKAERATASQARTNARNALVKAVRILMQWSKVAGMEKTGVRWTMKDSGEAHADGPDKGKPIMVLRNTPKPIVLWNKLEASEAVAVSVDTFLSYKVDTAIAKGGSLGDLTETASRDGSGGEPNAGSTGQVPRITNSASLEGYIAELAAYIETDEGKADMLRLASGKNAKNITVSLCIIADRTDSITTKNRHVYEAYLEEKSVKANAA